jgi:hypothetical protein
MYRQLLLATAFLSIVPAAALAQEDPTNKSAGSIPSTAPAGDPHPSSAPVSRAAVKAQTRDAVQSGTIAKGQAQMPGAGVDRRSTADKAMVGGEANKMVHSTQPIYGQTTLYMQKNSPKSTANRADVKAETKSMEMNNQLPRGEAAPMPNASTSAN